MSNPLLRRVLLTNDDGIAAPGLALLERIAAQLAEEVWVVAPEHDQSGTGQGISVHAPLRVYHHGERRFAVSGTPSDCVMFAMAEWLQDAPPDLVLSGVNSGANIGDSVPYSGTLGAVLSADLLGVPAIGLSQAFLDRTAIDWSGVERYAAATIRALWARRDENGCCWNVNFPACSADLVSHLRMTRQSHGSITRPRLQAGHDGRGLPYWWLGFEHSSAHLTDPELDVAALREKRIAITPLRETRAWLEWGEEWAVADLANNCDSGVL
ncbi:MAG: 5'/3'-nucleotidase SurE [Gammaproteobacteria bacterium]|nr:5'/3'-nucleotidase SurE [Gammaproteobacteria bacterium]